MSSVQSTPFGFEADKQFMAQALKQAQKALLEDEVPVGALVVDEQGEVIARAFNAVEMKKTQIAHAEMLALSKAGRKKGDWRLNGCWLYVTLEPCAMCMGSIQLSRIEGVVFGAPSPLFGFQLDNADGVSIYKKKVIQIISGINAEESAHILKQFFQKKRKSHERRIKETI